MKTPQLSRRSFVRLGGALVSLAAGREAIAAAKAAVAAAAGRKIPIALQLYSVRDECAKDMDVALEKVAALGFEGVEFAGYHKYKDDAAGLRKRLDALKLKAAGTHISAKSFSPDELKKTVEFHKTIGCKFLIVPGDKRFADPDRCKEYAQAMTDAAKALKPHGMFCGHHNHTGEFKSDPTNPGKTYWDMFAERTPKEVILQQDVGWTTVSGLDPAALVRKYPGRTRTTHFKGKLPQTAEGKRPFIGEDTIDWRSLIAACRDVGGTEWFTLEQEDYDGLPPLDAAARSLKGLKGFLTV